MNTTDKKITYINGIWVDEKKFDGGDSILKLSVLPDKFIEHIASLPKTERGYVKLVICKSKRTNTEGNSSHYMYWDSYGSVPNQEETQKQPRKAKPITATQKAEANVKTVDSKTEF